MSTDHSTAILTLTTEKLSREESLKGIFHQHRDGNPLPSAKALQEIIELSRSILFPGYYGMSSVNIKTIKYHIGVNIERLFDLLTGQVLAGLCFTGNGECSCCTELQREEAALIAAKFISNLPGMRRVLATDVAAAYNGDPAAHSFGEVISCYPAIRAISNYRIAHELLKLGVPLIPRIITEMAHIKCRVHNQCILARFQIQTITILRITRITNLYFFYQHILTHQRMQVPCR